MAIPESTAQIQMRGIQGGEMCYTNLTYYSTDLPPDVFAQDVLDDFKTQVWVPMRDLLSAKFTMLDFSIRYHRTDRAFVQAYTLGVNEQGLVPGDVLPPNVTLRLNKYPNNATKDPISAPDFEVGRVSLSGIPEAVQDDGLVLAFNLGEFQALADAMRVVNVVAAGDPQTFVLGMFRYTPLVPSSNDTVYVSSLVAQQALGTQNTRKR